MHITTGEVTSDDRGRPASLMGAAMIDEDLSRRLMLFLASAIAIQND